MMDSVPYPLNFACIALIKGLLYYNENLFKLYEKALKLSYEEVIQGKMETREKGLQGIYMGKSILDWGKELVEMAEKTLPEEEKKYLEPLREMLETGKNPRDQFEEIYKEKGLREAVDSKTMTEEALDA